MAAIPSATPPTLLRILLSTAFSTLRAPRDLAAENTALRQHLAILTHLDRHVCNRVRQGDVRRPRVVHGGLTPPPGGAASRDRDRRRHDDPPEPAHEAPPGSGLRVLLPRPSGADADAGSRSRGSDEPQQVLLQSSRSTARVSLRRTRRSRLPSPRRYPCPASSGSARPRCKASPAACSRSRSPPRRPSASSPPSITDPFERSLDTGGPAPLPRGLRTAGRGRPPFRHAGPARSGVGLVRREPPRYNRDVSGHRIRALGERGQGGNP